MCCNAINEMAKKFGEVVFIFKRSGFDIDFKSVEIGENWHIRVDLDGEIYMKDIEDLKNNMKCIGFEMINYKIVNRLVTQIMNIHKDEYIEFEFKYVGGEE